MSVRSRPAWIWGLAALTAAGAALRFATLSVQSFWLDEAVTHQLVTKSLGGMLDAIPHSESTPPLYYVVAWLWVRVFGAGEAGLRSLSALLGTATIVVLALIARRLAGERAALAAAALAATNPLLIWYSQEARAYMLLVLLCALTVWCLLRSDWRGVAKAIGRQTVGPRVVIVDPASGVPALQLYMPSLRRITQTSSPSVAAREIDVIDVARQPPDPATPIPLPGFTTSVVHTTTFTLVRYLAPAAITEGFVGIASRALVPASGPALLRGS